MKKIYSAPAFRVYGVRRANIICTSGNNVGYAGSNKDKGVNVAEGNSRGNAIWD